MSEDTNAPKEFSGPTPWWKKKKIIIPFALFVAIVSLSSNGSSEDSSVDKKSSSSAGPESSSEQIIEQDAVEIEEVEAEVEEPRGGEYGNYPAAQAKFLKIIEEGKNKIGDAETDLQESVALRTRDKDLCAVLGDFTATKWTGLIGNIGANGEGKAYLEIKLDDDVALKTHNNAFSDYGDNTLIPTTSPFFDDLVSMNKGDPVTFSATFIRGKDFCLQQTNITDFYYGRDPGFRVKFTSVTNG